MQDMVLPPHSCHLSRHGHTEMIAYLLPRNSALFVYLKISITFLGDEFIGRRADQRKKHWRVAKLVSCVPRPSPSHPRPRSVWPHYFPWPLRISTGPFTLSLLPEVRCGLKSSVSTKVIPGGGRGGSRCQSSRFNASLLHQSSSAWQGFLFTRHPQALSILPFHTGKWPHLENGPTWKMAPWRGAASSFPTELFVGPLILNTSTSGDKSCPPSFSNSPLNRIGATPTLNFGYEEN